MARSWDTGLALPQRTMLRNAVIAKLSPLLKSNGLYLRAVKPLAMPYGGEGDENGLALLDLELQGQFPSILVALGDGKYKSIGMDATELSGVIAVHVYVACANPRAPVEGRLAPDVTAVADDTADPGIDTMLEDVAQQLVGQDLGVDSIYEPHLLDERLSLCGPAMTVWELVFSVRVDAFINPDRAITTVVTSIASSTVDDTTPANVIVQTLTDLEAP